MRTLVATVHVGSCIEAMDSTGLSKPAVSRQVEDLKASLGVRLLQRTTRRLSITDEGRTYYLGNKDILLLVEEAWVPPPLRPRVT
ncbi:hypothetical protein P353_24895 [Comamonas testosteroni]|uniref:HTH lysR-type domain-containing protein n=2 Tax=Comamonas testosteroni TaxID=285 RepID=A0A096F5A0_COMTE|nr:hypothetical protein P353_24895 [Comamonas testosteroni]